MYKLIITEKLKREIDYLHKKLGSTEWSGILAYTIEGKGFNKSNDVVFVGLGMYVMDIGSQTSTEFSHKTMPLCNSYFTKTLGRSDFLIGSIHTHHTMGAFISQVDKNEIETNTNIFNNYLFLVVDTKDTYVAKLGRKKLRVLKEEMYVDELGNWISINTNSTINEVEVNDVEIEMPTTAIPDEEFIKVLTNLQQKKEKDKNVGLPVNYTNSFSTTNSYTKTNVLGKTDAYTKNAKKSSLDLGLFSNDYSLDGLYNSGILPAEYVFITILLDIENELNYRELLFSSAAEVKATIEEYATNTIIIEETLSYYLNNEVIDWVIDNTMVIIKNENKLDKAIKNAKKLLHDLISTAHYKGMIEPNLKTKFIKELEVLDGNIS